MTRISVIVATYKSQWEKIKDTLESLMSQTEDEFEIIVADDGSPDFPLEKVDGYLRNNSKVSFKIICNQINVGTVKNILNAAKLCKGKYIKPIGPGDLLYSKTTLKDVIDFMEKQQCECCFGLLRGYSEENKSIRISNLKRPRVIDVYEENKGLIKRNVILGDHPSGATLFYKRNDAIKYWTDMVNNSETLYCEDVITYQFSLEGKDPCFFPHYVVWYEVDAGISKREISNSINTKMYSDILTYVEYLKNKYSNDKKILDTKLRWCEFQISNAHHFQRAVAYLMNPKKLFFELYVRRNAYNSKEYDQEVGYLSDSMM